MEEERYINAIHKLARTTGLSVELVCDSHDPDCISVFIGVPGADNLGEHCSFQKRLVVEWVENASVEGQHHIVSRIETAKDRLRSHYRRNP